MHRHKAIAAAGVIGLTSGLVAPRPFCRSHVIDLAFLDALATLPESRSLTPEEDARYGTLFYENENQLLFLAREGDSKAIHVVLRLAARPSIPGGCCCESRRFRERFCVSAFEPGATDAFWRALEPLPAEARAFALSIMDDVSPVDWQGEGGERSRYLATDPATRTAYEARYGPADRIASIDTR